MKNPVKCVWADCHNWLAVIGEDLSQNPQIVIYNIPTRQQFLWQTLLIKVRRIEFKWQQQDANLILSIDAKKKKQEYTLVSVGQIKPKQSTIYVSHLDLPNTKQKTYFSPNNNFMILGKKGEQKKYDYCLYKLSEGKSLKIWSESKINKKSFFFSPDSSVLLLIENYKVMFAQIKSVKGALKLIFFKEIEVDKFSQVQWSPCGRFLFFIHDGATVKYTMYNCFGKAIRKFQVDKNRFFMIRSYETYPDLQLSPQELAQIKLQTKKNIEAYALEDKKKINLQKEKIAEEHKKNRANFNDYFNKKQAQWKERREARIKMLGYDEDEQRNEAAVFIVDKVELI